MGTLVQTLTSHTSSLGTYAGLAAHEGEAHAATGVTSAAWLLVALPMLGAALLLIGGRRTDKVGPVLATALSWGSFVVGAVVFFAMLGRGAEDRAQTVNLFDWISAGSFHVNAGLLVDQLSMVFVL